MATFAETRKENWYATVLDSGGGFAEQVTYTPASGQRPRTLTVLVANEIDAEADQVKQYDRERLVVSIGRDESHAKGGVERPERGDAIHRSGQGDESDRVYCWLGKVLGRGPHFWRLEFERVEVAAIGTIQMMRG